LANSIDLGRFERCSLHGDIFGVRVLQVEFDDEPVDGS